MLICAVSVLLADNQIIPGNDGTSDPAPMGENGTVYLYTTVDAVGNGDLSIYDNQLSFHYRPLPLERLGVVLYERDVPWAAQRGNLWAPHCIKLDGKFHLYFPANDGRTFHIGHAVSDSPTGPFIADREYMEGCGSNAIDPFVILDTSDIGSGKAYIAWNIVGRTPNEVYMKELNSTFDEAVGTRYDLTSGLPVPYLAQSKSHQLVVPQTGRQLQSHSVQKV